jgi:site-specific recombinase XerD
LKAQKLGEASADTLALERGNRLANSIRKFHCSKHSIAMHFLDAGAEPAFVKDWLGHANIQNTMIYARLTTATLDAQAWTIFASHRVV